MIDILLLAVFISVVLIGSSVFAGSEQQRAQQAREEAGYAQAQLITALQYRDPAWDDQTTAQQLGYLFCNSSLPPPSTNCTPAPGTQLTLQTVLNRTARDGYNYIFYAENATGYNFTVCDKQVSVCSKNLPSIAHTRHYVTCLDLDDSGRLRHRIIDYYLGIWPAWQTLPLSC